MEEKRIVGRLLVVIGTIILGIYAKGINSLNEELLIIGISIFFFSVGVVWMSEMVKEMLKEKVKQVEEKIKQMYIMRIYMLDTLKITIKKKFSLEKVLKNEKYKELEEIVIKIGMYVRKSIIRKINKIIEKILVISQGIEKKYVRNWYEKRITKRYKKVNRNIKVVEYFIKKKYLQKQSKQQIKKA